MPKEATAPPDPNGLTLSSHSCRAASAGSYRVALPKRHPLPGEIRNDSDGCCRLIG